MIQNGLTFLKSLVAIKLIYVSIISIKYKKVNEYKMIYNYEKINQQLSKDNNILNILNDNNDNISLQKIYSIIVRLPTDFIKEMNKKYNNENSLNVNLNINTNIKPSMILTKYYDYSQQKKEINIYDNFEILNQKIVELLTFLTLLDDVTKLIINS